MILVVCATLNDFGCGFDLRKIFVMCSTWKWLGRMLTATERMILAVSSIWKRFGLVSDLKNWQCARPVEDFYSSVRPSKDVLSSVRDSVLPGVWSCICSTSERVWLYVTPFLAIFFIWAFFPFPPALPWLEGKSKLLLTEPVLGWVPGPVGLMCFPFRCFVLSLLFTYVR